MSIFTAPAATSAPDTDTAPDFSPEGAAYSVLSGQAQSGPNLPPQQTPMPSLAAKSESLGQKLSSIGHGVLDSILGSKQTQTVDASGKIIPVPQSTGQRIGGVIGGAVRGAIAGAGATGPGHVGRAAVLGMQEEQQRNEQAHKDLMDQANLAFRNNEWLLRQREFDLHSEEFQRQIIDSDNALQMEVNKLGGHQLTIPGANGKETNGTLTDQQAMDWSASHPAPAGFSYLPTASLGKGGKVVYRINLIPHDSLNDPVHISEEQAAAFGLPPKDGGYDTTLAHMAAFQQTNFQNAGGAEMLKHYQEKFTGYKVPADSQTLTQDLDESRRALQFAQQYPAQGKILMPALQSAAQAIHSKMQEKGLAATPEAAAVKETGEKAAATGELGKNIAETQKAQFELGQQKRDAASIQQPDATGFTPTISKNEYDKRYDSFSKSKQMSTLQTLQGSYQQFQDTVANIQKTGSMTGAESVVGLFNAIGISATPLAGKGFRINAVTVQEHAEARGLGQAAYQKLLSLKAGDIITPRQLTDYSDIASQVYHHAFVNAADEAHRQGLPADFLPKGGGAVADPITMRIYRDAVLHANPRAGLPDVQRALEANGWRVQ